MRLQLPNKYISKSPVGRIKMTILWYMLLKYNVMDQFVDIICFSAVISNQKELNEFIRKQMDSPRLMKTIIQDVILDAFRINTYNLACNRGILHNDFLEKNLGAQFWFNFGMKYDLMLAYVFHGLKRTTF